MIGKRIGNYVIERILAHGGMGAVYVARDRALGRRVAVKFVVQDSECEAETARRFLEEARITASLQHPNVVTIFDYGEFEGRLYYVMELLAGSDLAVLMQSKKRFDIEQVRNCIDQICSGLQAAHVVGIVHRDLKPANIFVLEGEPLRIKLMDFGVAKILAIDEKHTCRGQIIGTPRYMSPEQALGQVDRISPRSDIYSLGIIVYEMLTGVRLFDDPSPIVLLMMHINDPVPRIRDLAPDLPSGVAELIESCLAKDPRERPQSALEFVARFAEVGCAASANLQYGSGTLARLIESGFVPPSNRALPGAPDTMVDVAPDVEALTSTAPAVHTLRLDKNDRATLNRLWLKMQQRGDFPAYVQGANNAGKHFGINSSNSVREFGESVLKDFALTAKLLRIINSA